MKNFLVLLSISVSTATLWGQSNQMELPKGNYVVVGAYRMGDEKFLEYYINHLKTKGLDPKFGYEQERNFYYVYLNTYPELKDALSKMEQVRQIPGLDKAWVRVKKVGGEAPVEVSPVAAPTKIEQQQQIKNTVQEQTIPTTESVVIEKPVEEISQPKIETTTQSVSAQPQPTSDGASLVETDVFLKVYDPQKNYIVDGEIELVDTERARLITKLKSNEKSKLQDPKSNSGKLSLICNIFGYRKVQQEISFPKPKPEEAQFVDGAFEVKFEMVRYQKGDIQTLYKVFFYNDAAVMLPESKYELNNLLRMMNDNPNYEIVLHGHTNGNARGKIVTMGTSKDFFGLTKENKVIDNGSAKELSNQRALTIRAWLISNGVAENRVDVKPWGGKRMLHDKNGIHAKKNIRVEVEVVKD